MHMTEEQIKLIKNLIQSVKNSEMKDADDIPLEYRCSALESQLAVLGSTFSALLQQLAEREVVDCSKVYKLGQSMVGESYDSMIIALNARTRYFESRKKADNEQSIGRPS